MKEFTRSVLEEYNINDPRAHKYAVSFVRRTQKKVGKQSASKKKT